MPRCQITSPELPRAVFFSYLALREFVHEALRYEHAVRAYTEDGDDITLAGELAALGFDAVEITRHVAKPGYRMARGYA